MKPESLLHLSDALLERAVDEYYAEYHRLFPRGGDAGDHDEAVRSAVHAAVAAALQVPTDLGKCDCGCWDYQTLKAERDRLRDALTDMTTYVRLGMTWIEDSDRHAKMRRAWERGREALGQEAI